ncbi:MAG: ribonuclease E/G, partial [Clostridiaceae bacterium]
KEGIGILIRKKAENVNIDMVLEEIEILHNEYENLLDKKEYEKKLGCLYSPQGLIGEVLRDYMDLTVKTIYVNNISDYQVLTEAVKKYKDFLGNIILYENYQSIFLKYSLEEEIKKTMNKKIELPCRGNIVIDKTEAMYVIDVNSAKNIKGKSKESTAYITNLEASKEIAKQIILRNLSGIILIDFINIEDDSKKEKILNSLEEGFLNDKNKPKVYPFTELNLVQMTRKKSTPLSYYIEEDCEACSGSGKRLRLSYLELLIKNRIKSNNKADKFFIEINSIYKNQVEIDKDKFIEKIGIEKQNLFIRFSEFVGDFTVKFTLSEKEIEFYLKY